MPRTKNPEFPLEQTHPSEMMEEEDPPTGFEREVNPVERENNSEDGENISEEEANKADKEDNNPNSDEEDKNSEEDGSGTLSDREEEEDEEDGSDSGEETEAMQPLQMYFPPSEYKKKIKISTRCYIADTLETLLDKLDPPLTSQERSWFETHPKFQHIFHMTRDKNHRVQGMWMLLFLTACTEKEKEACSVVNAFPFATASKNMH
ncbi:unnamed protein product [Microthlaspi erraticum]|uniref:Uncharacterized protein n=1 Tax=Microthlaspi erraticum TaxID=1685480 RepID=A0A6D2HKB2_9BRAS|nr:unnamed protein product [Microthlaspi erraticum]CAA7048593.1 unnamed protein product [Microthlaspi erraticum]